MTTTEKVMIACCAIVMVSAVIYGISLRIDRERFDREIRLMELEIQLSEKAAKCQ